MARHRTSSTVVGPVKRTRVKGTYVQGQGWVHSAPPGYGNLPHPPPGTYDPAIDASERAAQRGYGDLTADTGTAGLRAASDYGVGLSDLGRTRDYGLADILRGKTRAGEDLNIAGAQVQQDYSRNLSDLLSTRTRAGEDYKTNLATLDRNYTRLGGQQAQRNAAAGLGGGALMQALQKRTANEAIDRAPIDTGYQRFSADSAQSEQRLGENRDQAVSALDLQRTRGIEDYRTQTDRLTQQYGARGTDYGEAGQKLSLDYQRGGEDRATQLARAGRELNAYQSDLVPARYYGAAGLTPYAPPKRFRRRR